MTIARLMAVFGLLLVSCGDADDDSTAQVGGELLPFSLVQENDFTFEADPTDSNRGIFRVRTTEPMICAIVWGETEAFGMFNNSLAMNGSGIIDHDVVLPGAVPGQSYFFRVQGTTADGSQYRSEIGTFVIPEPEREGEAGPVPAGENLAVAGSIIEASSEFGPGWEAENAIDDDLSTEWATGGDGDAAFIAVDLGAEHDIVGVEFLTRSMLDGTAITEEFTVTVDGAEPVGPFPAGNPANRRVADVSLRGQRLRFDVASSTGGNVGAIEIRVFGPVGG